MDILASAWNRKCKDPRWDPVVVIRPGESIMNVDSRDGDTYHQPSTQEGTVQSSTSQSANSFSRG
jgi:hypothetical protein